MGFVERAKKRLKEAGQGRLSLAALLAIATYLYLPTGTPDDLFVALPLLSVLGLTLYALVGAVLVFALVLVL